MDEWLVGLITLGIFATGWCVSYAAAKWIFRCSTNRMTRLEERLRSEDPGNIVLWRRGIHGYYLGAIHFGWIVLIILFEIVIFVGGTGQVTDVLNAAAPTLTIVFFTTIFIIAMAPLQALESGFSVVVANDDGIRRLRPGLRGRKETARISWDDIVGVDRSGGTNQIDGIAIAGSGRVIHVRMDANNLGPLCDRLIKRVPRNSFTIPAYSYCRIYAD